MEKIVSESGVVGEKRGVKVYSRNPSVPDEGKIRKVRRGRLGNERSGMIIDDSSGEIIGRGGAISYELEEVDQERFVKLFLEGIRQASGLTKAGLAVFEIVYDFMQEHPGSDTVTLSHLTAGLSRNQYYRGLKELLEKEFIFRTPYDGTFFVNIRYMFNGDRLAFVKAYHLKGADSQPSLPLE